MFKLIEIISMGFIVFWVTHKLGEGQSVSSQGPNLPNALRQMRGDDDDEYRFIQWDFIRNYLEANSRTKLKDRSIAAYKQKGTLTEKEKKQMDMIQLPVTDIDFGETGQFQIPKELRVLMRSELHLFSTEMSSQGFDPMTVMPQHLDMILNGAMRSVRNSEADFVSNQQSKAIAASYLFSKIGRMGFITLVHEFKPKQFLDLHKYNPQPSGSNILVLVPGSKFGTKKDKILVVGAHWDTVKASPGFNDNGSGVAAILETLRALAMSDCKAEYSIIFALFDIEEYGSQGSMLFVQDVLIPDILQKLGFPGFQGAYILDSIMNFNASIGSQTLPNGYNTHMPDQCKEIQDNGSRGDFIGVFSRPSDDQLSKRFTHHWHNKQDHSSEEARKSIYKIKEFQIKGLNASNPGDENLVKYANFLRSDHVRFWFSNHQDFYASFKAALISDTGPARGIMDECYHEMCDSSAMNKTTTPFANLEFLSKVVQATIDTVLDASQATCAKSKRKIEAYPSKADGSYYFKLKSPFFETEYVSLGKNDIIDNSKEEPELKPKMFAMQDSSLLEEQDPKAEDGGARKFQHTNAHFLVQPVSRVKPSYFKYKKLFPTKKRQHLLHMMPIYEPYYVPRPYHYYHHYSPSMLYSKRPTVHVPRSRMPNPGLFNHYPL